MRPRTAQNKEVRLRNGERFFLNMLAVGRALRYELYERDYARRGTHGASATAYTSSVETRRDGRV